MIPNQALSEDAHVKLLQKVKVEIKMNTVKINKVDQVKIRILFTGRTIVPEFSMSPMKMLRRDMSVAG